MSEKELGQDLSEEVDSTIEDEEADLHSEEEQDLEAKQSLIVIDQNNKIKGIVGGLGKVNGKRISQALKNKANPQLLQGKINNLKSAFRPASLKGLATAIIDKESYKEILEIALLNKKAMLISISLGLAAGIMLAII